MKHKPTNAKVQISEERSLRGFRQLADAQAGHRRKFGRGIGQVGRGRVIPVAGRDVPVPPGGHSAKKPFCDLARTPRRSSTAPRAGGAAKRLQQDQAKVMRGPAMSLTDAEHLCAFARFCDPHGQVWSLVDQTDDPAARLKQFVREASDCPSGRLVAWDNATGASIEPSFEPSIGLVEDPAKDVRVRLWLRGGVPVVRRRRPSIRGAQPRDPLPRCRSLAEQTLLRRCACVNHVQGRPLTRR